MNGTSGIPAPTARLPRPGWRWLSLAFAVAIVGALLFAARGPARPDGRFFEDQTFNFQTLRAFSTIPSGGADTAEILRTIDGIPEGDFEAWHRQWKRRGDLTAALAGQTADDRSAGEALLRASTYYRAAEFFLPPDDPRRRPLFAQAQASFYRGLGLTEVEFERGVVAFEGAPLPYLHWPSADSRKPLIVMIGGLDSTLEELWFVLAKEAQLRGYPVVAYDGPGQGAVLRLQGRTMRPDWEKPNSAVLDHVLAAHPEYRGRPIVLFGMSLGGYLAPRAAAFDDRVTGVVAWNQYFDGAEILAQAAPLLVRMREMGLAGVAERLAPVAAARNPGLRWAMETNAWVFGLKRPRDVGEAYAGLTLRHASPRIRGDVLILAGADDHFIPLGQADAFRRALVNARSVEQQVYHRESGGSEHCQLGAYTLWRADLFGWLARHFPDRATASAGKATS